MTIKTRVEIDQIRADRAYDLKEISASLAYTAANLWKGDDATLIQAIEQLEVLKESLQELCQTKTKGEAQ